METQSNREIDVSVIILTWNSSTHLHRLFATLEEDLSSDDYTREYLVVDNGSTDDSIAILRSLQQTGVPIQLIPLGRNTGTTFSRNIGLRLARGRHVAVLDSDIAIDEPHTFERLISRLESQCAAGIVSPRLIFASRNHQKSADEFPTLSRKIRRLFFLREIEGREAENLDAQAEVVPHVDYTCSAFWVFRHSLIAEIGFLDERIFYAPEDVDYCLRCWLSGNSVLYDTSTTAVHDAQEISRRSLFSRSARLHIAGLFYFFLKYRFLFRLKRIRGRISKARSAKLACAND